MSLEYKYNTRNPAVKRLMREACELTEPTDEYCARPLDDNLFEWHFTVHGSPTSEYEGGVYHGRILLPTDYPMKPPNIILLTPNGRFEVNKKICLSISGHHPETWQPSWSIRTALLALIAFMTSPGNGAIGSLDYTTEERKTLAKKSKGWECRHCGKIADLLSTSKPVDVTPEETDMIRAIALKAEEVPTKVECVEEVEDVREEEVEDPTQLISSHGAQEESSEGDCLMSLIWVLLAAIFLLIARRVFLL